LQRQNGVARIVLTAEQTLEVEVVQRLLDGGQRAGGFAGRLGVALGGELEVELRLIEGLLLFAPRRERSIQRGAFAQRLLRAFAVVPKIRCCRDRVELLNARLSTRQVKDTSRRLRGAVPARQCDLSTRSARCSSRGMYPLSAVRSTMRLHTLHGRPAVANESTGFGQGSIVVSHPG